MLLYTALVTHGKSSVWNGLYGVTLHHLDQMKNLGPDQLELMGFINPVVNSPSKRVSWVLDWADSSFSLHYCIGYIIQDQQVCCSYLTLGFSYISRASLLLLQSSGKNKWIMPSCCKLKDALSIPKAFKHSTNTGAHQNMRCLYCWRKSSSTKLIFGRIAAASSLALVCKAALTARQGYFHTFRNVPCIQFYSFRGACYYWAMAVSSYALIR